MASFLVPVSLLAAGLLLVPQIFGDFFAYQIGLYLIYGIAAQGIGYLWGKTGILPLGQALFFGIAAYFAAHILSGIESLALQLVLTTGVVLTISLLAFALASLIFRGRADSGPYFSLITLALVMIGEQVAGSAISLTGGFNGYSGFDAIGGLDPFGNLYILIVVVTVAVTALLLALERLPISLVARAIADNEPRLQLFGFRTHLVKGLVFGFSAALACLAGVLFASHQGIVTPTSTGFGLSAELVILTAVGGRFHVFGPLLGAVLTGWISAELRDTISYWEVLMAGLFIVVVLWAPGGMSEMMANLVKKVIPPTRREEEAVISPPPPRHDHSPGSLSFRNVHLRIGIVDVLNGTTFDIPESGIIAMIGPNGAGKTTALNSITGNLRITDGDIRLGNESIRKIAPYEGMERGIGRKLQTPSVFDSMTLPENLAISMMAGRAGWLDHFRISTLGWRSDALLEVLDHPATPIDGEMQDVASTLPQGHRQFLEFAMTVASKPALLLLDEPCAGLSPGETATMSGLVRSYQERSQGLILMIEHDMGIVEAVSDRVLVLHQGSVLAFGRYGEVATDPAVQAVYGGRAK